MSQEESEKRCKYDTLDIGGCFKEGDDPSPRECANCMIQQIALSLEDEQNVTAMRLLHILKDIVKELS